MRHPAVDFTLVTCRVVCIRGDASGCADAGRVDIWARARNEGSGGCVCGDGARAGAGKELDKEKCIGILLTECDCGEPSRQEFTG